MAPTGSGADEGNDSSLFFLLALLICIVFPWTFSVVWGFIFAGRQDIEKNYPKATDDGARVRECQTAAMAAKRESHVSKLGSRRRMLSAGFVFRTACLGLLWCWLLYIVVALRTVMATSSLYVDFDPYKILEVSSYTSTADIKKAWRKLSLKYHPDKNKDSGAVEKFIMMKKAYDSLTDPVASANFKRYGNPDGPARVDLGVALPKISKERQTFVLVVFVFVFILGVPLSLLLCMASQGPSKCPNGLYLETMEKLAEKLLPSTDMKGAQALFLVSRECMASSLDSEDLVKELDRWVVELKLKAPPDMTDAERMRLVVQVLFAMHCQRRTGELGEVARRELIKLLPHWYLLAQGIAEIAMRQGWQTPFDAALELQQCVLQALVPGSSGVELLQVPHLDAERVKSMRKGPLKNLTLSEFGGMQQDGRRKALEAAGLSPSEMLDAEEFARCLPRVTLEKVTIEVDGEEDVCKDDIATLRVQFCRQNLAAGEAAGAVHAPFFADEAVPEVWWLSLTLSVKGSKPRFGRVVSRARDGVAVLKFKVPAIGKNRGKVTFTCEAYRGLEIEQQVTFDAKRPEIPGNGGADPDDEVSDMSGHGED